MQITNIGIMLQYALKFFHKGVIASIRKKVRVDIGVYSIIHVVICYNVSESFSFSLLSLTLSTGIFFETELSPAGKYALTHIAQPLEADY